MTDMNTVDNILEKVDPKNRASIQEAASALIGLNNIAEGDTVTITDGSTYPYEGQTGKVVSIDKATGMSKVKFPNNENPVDMITSLLIPIK